MASKKETSKEDPDQEQAFDPTHIDPALESKVDAMMSSDNAEPEISAETLAPEESVSSGPPLLPTEKLKKIKIFHDESSSDESLVSGKAAADEQPLDEETAEAADNLENSISEEEASAGEAEPAAETEAISEEIEPQESDSAKELGLEDPETGKLVDAIVAEEADELLEAQDERAGKEEPKAPALLAAQGKPHSKFKSFLKAWWGSRFYRSLTILLLLAGIAAAAILPASRYFLLNTAGVRASSSMIILDQATNQPLKNVEVILAGQTGKTDKEGKVLLQHIKLGSQTLIVRKPAFADATKDLVIGWGSNPLGTINLTPVGSRYTFNLTDFLSGKPVNNAEASSGEASASANDKGEIVLTVPRSDDTEIEVIIAADNYRREVLKIPNATTARQQLQLVPARKAVFVSKRTGTFDVYKIDADGKNEQKILPGTGSEQADNMTLVMHPTKEIAAFVSTRGSVRNKDGFLLSTLNIINLESGSVVKLAQSERIQVVDWIGDRLVYVKIAEGESAASPKRHRLLSYDLKTEQEKELASTNYFNDIMVAQGAVYYSPAIYKINGAIGLFRINADGSDKRTIIDKEAWNLFRTDFDHISVSIGQEWYDYTIADSKFNKAGGPPPALASRLYIASPDNSRSLWVEDRDGKGTLLLYTPGIKEDKVLQTQSGLKNPIRWLDSDHIIYRVAGGSETADYILSLSGGQPKKITDVTNTAGTDRWYYY